MAKTVIVSKCLENGVKRVFETIEEATKTLGISDTSISTACVDCRETKGYMFRRADRVYLLHMRRHDDWMLAVRNSHGKFVEFSNPVRRVAESEYDEVRDITVGWYWQ